MDLNSLASHPALTSFNEGVGRGFLLYFLPLTVLRKHVQKKIMRRALAIGLFCGTIRLIRHYVENKEGEIKNIINKSVKENGVMQLVRRLQALAYKYPYYFAGGMGAIASIIADPSLIQSELIIIWIMVRAIRSVIPHIPFASTIAMCLASSQVLSTWMKQPAHLDGSYVKFLNGQAGIKASIVRKLRTTQMIRPCETFHPNELCVFYLARFFKDGFVRALRVYAPLYVVFFLFSKSKNVVYLVQNLIRSSAFLAIYCTLAWGSCCTFHHLFPSTAMSRKNIFLYTWVAGISTLIERTNRRAELAAYVSTYAIDSLIKTAVSTGRVPRRLALLKPIILVLSVAVMVHNRKDQPWIFSHFMLGDTSPTRKEVPIERV